MKFFAFGNRKGGQSAEYSSVDQVAHEDKQRISELTKLNLELVRQNVELSREVIRLSQRVNPIVSDEEIEDPPTTSAADMREARRGEQIQRPANPGLR